MTIYVHKSVSLGFRGLPTFDNLEGYLYYL